MVAVPSSEAAAVENRRAREVGLEVVRNSNWIPRLHDSGVGRAEVGIFHSVSYYGCPSAAAAVVDAAAVCNMG